MSLKHLRGLDLNLLLALDALLDERSVTRAATRAGVTQSGMSRSLGRLRALLKDPILVRAGGGMLLTPRAEELQPELREALRRLDAVMGREPAFDPSTARRAFRVATADYTMVVLVPALLARLEREAPGVELVAGPLPSPLEGELLSGALDVAVAPPRPSSPGMVWTRLFADRNVCIAGRGPPGKSLSLEAYCSLPHLVVSAQGRASRVDEVLERRGLRRRVALRVPSFLLAPLLVARSDLVATVPARVAQRVAGPLSLRVYELPLPLPEFTVALGWHERFREDPAHAWFRRTVVAAARESA